MSFQSILERYNGFDFQGFFKKIKPEDVESCLSKETLSELEYLALLSGVPDKILEQMAQRAHSISLQNFGKAILLYTPMYLSNYCENTCLYCGFNAKTVIERKKLTPEEVEKEAAYIAATGLRHILILTGESRKHTPVSYVAECVEALKKYFSSISIEIYPLTEEEYACLITQGIDGLTVYQEVYDRTVYATVHPQGPKSDYLFRLNAPERACKQNIRAVNIGSLLGLHDWRTEAFFAGLHARYLQDTFSSVEIGLSVPRIRALSARFKPSVEVSDRSLAQIVLAYRLFLPRAGIALSTRENALLRENLLPLGITRMSAQSTTAVGGHTADNCGRSVQFDISDSRDVRAIKRMLLLKGYEPILKDWMLL